MRRLPVVLAAAAVVVLAGPVVATGALVLVAGGVGGTSFGAATPGSGAAVAAVPPAWEAFEQQAAATCPGLDWTVLAAIGRLESDSGRAQLPGVASGANAAGAEGPFQFEPATFAAYATVGPGGAVPASPYDPIDAAYTAAALLCADGAGRPATVSQALFDYDHSSVYVASALVLSAALDAQASMDATVATALVFEAGQLGAPYLWGGTGPGGWDCSGLVQAAYRTAGVDLPRVAQDQYDAGPPVVGGAVAPGDLLFFGASSTLVDHVGLYVGNGEMIDAPHTGAVVRFDPAEQSDLVGVTRPG